MSKFRVFVAVFSFLFLQIAALSLLICFSPISQHPILLTPSQEAAHRTEAMLDAVCQGDFSTAESFLLGQPSLGADRPSTQEAGVLFWDAFVASLSYELQGPCYATDSGLCQNVAITCLDIHATSATLGQRSALLLEALLAQSDDTSDVYDENNNYREDVVMQVLRSAVEDALEEDAVYRTVTVTVTLIHSDGQWWIVPDAALLNAISGGIIS